MGESNLKKALGTLSVLGSVDGRVPAGVSADYVGGVLILDTPAPYPDGGMIEIFLGKAGVRRGVEVLGRARSENRKLVIRPILQVDTVADIAALREGHLPTLPDELLDPENLFDMVRRLDNLPTLPTSVAKVLEVTISESTTAADVARVISQDPVLSAEILRLANSAYYGLEQQVATVDRAVVMLGFDKVRMAALTLSVLRMWTRRGTTAGEGLLPAVIFDEQAFWQHCLGVAVAAEALERSFGMFTSEHAFVAGLFHDIGKVVLSQFLSPIFSRALVESRRSGGTIHAAELKTTGLAHERIGEWLISAWGLPMFIRQAVEHHHLPELAGENEMAPAIVHLADILTRALGLGSGGDDLIPNPHATTWKKLDLSEERLVPVVKSFFKEVVTSQVFFSMMVGRGVPEAVSILAGAGENSQGKLALAERIRSREVEEETPETRALLKSMADVLTEEEWAE